MTVEYSASGDPTRSMQLLWGLPQPPRRGPKPKLTVAQITQTAIAVADADGLGALSMRRVADELGVTAMSLYTYVPGKAELIDLMLDSVQAEYTAAPPGTEGWRDRLEMLARQLWAMAHRHPWMLQVATSRPLLGPNALAAYELMLAAVDGVGLTSIEMDMTVTLVADYVRGAARSDVEMAQATARTGVTDLEWWNAYAPLLEQVYDPAKYPTADRIGPEVGEEYGAGDPVRAFEFGLQRVLDGIAVMIERR